MWERDNCTTSNGLIGLSIFNGPWFSRCHVKNGKLKEEIDRLTSIILNSSSSIKSKRSHHTSINQICWTIHFMQGKFKNKPYRIIIEMRDCIVSSILYHTLLTSINVVPFFAQMTMDNWTRSKAKQKHKKKKKRKTFFPFHRLDSNWCASK